MHRNDGTFVQTLLCVLLLSAVFPAPCCKHMQGHGLQAMWTSCCIITLACAINLHVCNLFGYLLVLD